MVKKYGVVLLTLSLVATVLATLPACKESEYHYEFTECGSDGGRWHVPVPYDPKHCSVTYKPAIRHKTCDSSCPAGQYLDVSTKVEACKPCAVGKYSLGGTVRYYNWSVMPPEFDTYSIKSYTEEMPSTSEKSCNKIHQRNVRKANFYVDAVTEFQNDNIPTKGNIGGSFSQYVGIFCPVDQPLPESSLGDEVAIYNLSSSWVPRQSYIRTDGTSCITRLTYSTTIEQSEGSLTFWYYYTNEHDNVYFDVSVRNEQCQISSQGDGNEDGRQYNYDTDGSFVYPDPVLDYKWKNYTLKLKRGKNLVVWQVEHLDTDSSVSASSNTVFIRDIEVKGVRFKTECAPCPAGNYADKEGSSWCKPCPENEISNSGSEKCTPCDKEKEYAPSGSSKCLLRAPCKESDYIETSSACGEDNKYQTVYHWIEPKICSHTINGAIKLPLSGPKKDCPPCNIGMNLNDTKCLFCPPGTFSDGKRPCEKCPPSTAPVLKHSFRWWRSVPPSITYGCSSSHGKSCSTFLGWLLRGDYLDSGTGHADDVTLNLEIQTKGFAGESGLVSRTASTVGMVRIDFELDCDGPCFFIMYEREHHEGMTKILSWSGRQARQNYSYAVTSKGPRVYIFKFKKSEKVYHSSAKTHKYTNDRVKVYSIVLTNTVDGGAEECRECPVGRHESGCIECPKGHYIDKVTKKCKPCGKDTYLSNNTCVKCGPGLSSSPGSSKCFSSCHYHTKDGHHLDFVPLNGYIEINEGNPPADHPHGNFRDFYGNQSFQCSVHSVQTQKSFLSVGSAYFYEYRINLCGIDASSASCHSNVSFGDRRVVYKYLNASICQMRILPGKNGGKTLAMGLAGIGHQLMGIYEEKPHNVSLELFKDEKLLNESLLYFDFLSHETTPSCPNGRSAWIILRCDSQATDDETIKFPPGCHEGTCDGCQFLFLWHTKHACPLCTEKDYSKIESGCFNRKKTIHYNWNTAPRGCAKGASLPKTEVLDCHDMTVHEAVKQFQILIGIVAFMVTAILASFVFLWYKNRVLKYKLYHRVAVNESYQAEDLPQAQSCVADDEEEDEERVEFRKGEHAGKKLFKQLKRLGNKESKEDDTFKLNESSEVDLS